MGLFSSLLAKWKNRGASPETPEVPLLPEDEWVSGVHRDFPRPEGFPEPDWEIIQHYLRDVPEDQQPSHFVTTVTNWMDELGAALGPEFNLYTTADVLYLSPRPPQEVQSLVRFAAKARTRIQNTFAHLSNYDGSDPVLIVEIEDPDLYWRYCASHHEDGEYGGTSGMCLRRGHPHIALNVAEGIEAELCLAHELVHFVFAERGLPLWLEEGIAQFTEKFFGYRSGSVDDGIVDQEMMETHYAIWDEETIQKFWSGRGFSSPGDLQKVSYNLALVLVTNLAQNYKDLKPFVEAATFADAGQAAAEEHLGLRLEDLVARFLGGGDWVPRSFQC